MASPLSIEPSGESRAFVAVRFGDRSWLVDVPLGEHTLIGSSAPALVVLPNCEPPDAQALVLWDGGSIKLRTRASVPMMFLNGKKLEADTEVVVGDELSIGGAHLVFGVSSGALPAARRALTHAEFKERVAEEIARARRRRRATALVMAMARPGEGQALLQSALSLCRAGDVVATYAHDEIELLLPDTERDRALRVVDRVIAEGELVGIVHGIAIAPEDADHAERLLRTARTSLRHRLADLGRALPRRPIDEDPVLEDATSRAAFARLLVGMGKRAPILVTGESSSGKVAFARLAHRMSGGGPFVVISCAAHELERDQTRARTALQGTLVLDEICDLPAGAQASWLSLLQEFVGSSRLLVTTSRDLPSAIARGSLTPDFASFLSDEEPVSIPPLRGRAEDIIPLASRFAEEAGAPTPVQLSAGALARIRSYPWPGNVLELRNAMERCVRLAQGGEILAEHLPGDSLAAAATDGRLREHVDSVERDAIVKALAESNHNQTRAAVRLGLSRRALIYKMEKYGLKAPPSGARKRKE